MTSNPAPVPTAKFLAFLWPLLALLSCAAVLVVAWPAADGLPAAAAFRNQAITACLALCAGGASLLSWRAAARERENEEVRLAYRTATETANDGFYMATPVRDREGQVVDFRIVDCNESGARFYGMPRTRLLGSALSDLGRGREEDLLATYKLALSTGFLEEERRMPADPRLNIAWARRRLVRVGSGLAVTIHDISERKAHADRIERLAHEDAMTGIPNRHWLLNHIHEAVAATARDGCPLALLFVDLDDFKQVNDTHGHSAGDRLLVAASKRLQALLRPADRVARFGGDQFIVVLRDAQDEQRVARVAERIVVAFRAPFSLGDGVHATVGASVGVSIHCRDGADTATLIRHADIAMHAAKNEGKGQYRLFDHALAGMVERRNQLKLRLRAATADDFTLHYQPRVDPHSLELRSMEALLRWQDREWGMVSPAEFIPIAEASGLIHLIGDIVIDKACSQIAAWRAAGLVPAPVSINVSARQFTRGVARKLGAALASHEIAPGLLELEITESAMMDDHANIISELAAIRALGVKLHVDDFGTGYSSLSQLQRLRMDVLKVDRAFTSELGRSAEGKILFGAIVSMARALGMEVVAEGVESAAQLDILRELGCNEVQGYYISKPLPADLLAGFWLRRPAAQAA